MIQAIIFDFDGVIVESSDIKTEAFKELFADYAEKIEKIIDYHIKNGGISRYIKFKYIYENILGRTLLEKEARELGRRFSGLVLKKILSSPLVPGVERFLNQNVNEYYFYIVSGTPDEELNVIIKEKGLGEFFKGIYGSSRSKPEIMRDIIKSSELDKNKIVFIGDAESDRSAASEIKITYIERNKNKETNFKKLVIKDFINFNKFLKNIT